MSPRRFLPWAVAVLLVGGLVVGVTGVATADPPWPRIGKNIADAAISQIGKAESGGENYYPRTYKISNDIVRPAEWCGVFVNWAWWKGGAHGRPNMRGTGKNQGHWATYWQKWGKSKNRWTPISEKSASVGEAVVYGNWPDSVHVGVVVGVKRNSRGDVTHVRTVEGNVGDKVKDLGYRKLGDLTGRGKKATGFVRFY